MKIRQNPFFPQTIKELANALGVYWRELATNVNGLSAGEISAYQSNIAAPSAGSWNKGDYVRNSSPSELGTAGSKYVILGWVCVASGTPGTWKETRTLTGA